MEPPTPPGNMAGILVGARQALGPSFACGSPNGGA